jgi:hypothetical protein
MGWEFNVMKENGIGDRLSGMGLYIWVFII